MRDQNKQIKWDKSRMSANIVNENASLIIIVAVVIVLIMLVDHNQTLK